MCGVLGIAIKSVDDSHFETVRNLFTQSMIRGKHATGVSYVKNSKVITIKEPIPADEFIKKYDVKEWVNEDGNLYCIGHVRYSTSDLRYNQPIATEELSIVHNGVISQEPSEQWPDLFGYKTETKNDSELILRCLENKEIPLHKFVPSSMSVCTIDKNKIITAFRNEARPLHRHFSSKKIIFASTGDILKRCKIQTFGITPMYEVFTVDIFNVTAYNRYSYNNLAEDLQ
jgi:glutamine phosphoribosylpyrophosphate amidotransferase